ncbi:MAG: UDP-3-O-(3-hydroxymyristoyl)glucosamine N-acyltransferase [Kiritimatiellales bacterium]
MKLVELAEKIGGKLDGAGDVEIRGVAAIGSAEPGEISFLANPKYAAQAAATNASALIVPENWSAESPAAFIRVKNPDAAFAQATMLFYTPPPAAVAGVHPSAVVAPDAIIGENASIGPLCVVESGVTIGAGTVLVAQCYIGANCTVGKNCLFYPHVSLRESVKTGDHVILHNGTVIGSDGFGYSVDEAGVRTKIPQVGTVEISDDVEIGANTTIDRARFGKTKIGTGAKIDNQVQIAHNVEIGEHVVLVSQVGIAGSARVGEKSILAGKVGVNGHIEIGKGVVVGPMAGVTKSVPDGAYLIGMPAVAIKEWKRSTAAVALLPKLKERIAALEKRIKQLEQSG